MGEFGKHVNKVLFATGWGTTSYSGQTSDVLLEVLLPIWKLEDCQKSYTQPISDKQMCAGYKQGGRDSCQVMTTHAHCARYCLFYLKVEIYFNFFF